MQTDDSDQRTSIRYQPDEKPPLALTIGLGLQLAILCIAGVVLTPAIVIRAAGGSEAFLSWAVFAAVAVSGVTTGTPRLPGPHRRGRRPPLPRSPQRRR